MVPIKLRDQVMFDNHDNLTAKQLGITRTYERIRKKYFWTGMYNDVKK